LFSLSGRRWTSGSRIVVARGDCGERDAAAAGGDDDGRKRGAQTTRDSCCCCCRGPSFVDENALRVWSSAFARMRARRALERARYLSPACRRMWNDEASRQSGKRPDGFRLESFELSRTSRTNRYSFAAGHRHDWSKDRSAMAESLRRRTKMTPPDHSFLAAFWLL